MKGSLVIAGVQSPGPGAVGRVATQVSWSCWNHCQNCLLSQPRGLESEVRVSSGPAPSEGAGESRALPCPASSGLGRPLGLWPHPCNLCLGLRLAAPAIGLVLHVSLTRTLGIGFQAQSGNPG